MKRIQTLIYGLLFMSYIIFLNGCKKSEEGSGPSQPDTSPIVLDCDFFETDRIIEDDPNRPVDYIVTCVAKVKAAITIKEGVVIEFEDDAGLIVADGYLTVVGTHDNKVKFTGKSKVKGSWRGIFFQNKSVNNILRNAIVEYAGGNSFNSNNNRANVILYSGASLSMNDTELRNGKEHGFSCEYGSAEILEFEDNLIEDNDKYPIISRTNFGHMFNNCSFGVLNGENYIFLKGGQSVGGHRNWVNREIPYLIDGNLKIVENESLSVNKGVTILFMIGSEIEVGKQGYLETKGEVGEMVKLSGYVASPGSWLGIINWSADPRNVIEHTLIEYAGGGQHNSNGDLGSIVVWGGGRQSVSNTTFKDNDPDAPCAVNAPYGSDVINLSQNQLVNVSIELCQ